MLRKFSHCLLPIVVSVCLAGCSQKGNLQTAEHTPRQAYGGVLRIAAQLPESLDPIHSKYYWESEIVLQIFDGLLRFDQNLNLAPALAEDWQVSPDGRLYTFRLRKGVRFHNGREVTANDFIYSLARHLEPNSKSEDAEHYSKILGASQYRQGKAASVFGLASPDPYTLKITLERSYAPFLRVLAQQSAAVVPREEVENPSARFGKRPTGTGPFRFEEWDSAGQIRLSMNPDYFEGRPCLDGILIKTLSDLNPQRTFEDFRNGSLDMSFVPSNQFQVVQSSKDWKFMNCPAFRIVYLGMNLRNAVMRDENVRKAIYFSINKPQIVGQDPDFEIVNHLIPLSLLGSNPSGGRDVYNPQTAREALRKSSLSKGRSSRIELWHATPTEERRRLLGRLAGSLQAEGIAAEVKIAASVQEMLQRIQSGEAQLFLYGEVIDFPDPDALVNRLFNSRSEGNLFGYSNPKVDRLLLQGQTDTRDEVRAQIYSQIEQRVMQDHVIVPLFSAKYSFVVQKRVRGIEFNSLGLQYLPFRKVWLRKAS